MSYEEFMEIVVQRLQENNSEMRIQTCHIEKLQGQSYDGISIAIGDESVAAAFDMGSFYEEMQEGKTLHEIVERIQDSCRENRQHLLQIDFDVLKDYNSMKAFITVQLIPQKGNEKYLNEIPHKKIEDLALVYRMVLPWDEERSGSILLTNENLKHYGVTLEQLHQDAMQMAPVNEAPLFMNMSELWERTMGFPLESKSDPITLYVATVQSKYYGAAVISYPGFLEEASKKIGGDFYILPSSVHECLFLKDDGEIDFRGLEKLVVSINEFSVMPEERLSNHIYHYDSKEKLFELAESYDARMQQEMAVARQEEEQQNENNNQEVYRVLLVEPNDYPKVVEIGTALEDLQQAVDGDIQAIYPFDDRVCLIMNEEGKINGMPLNRSLYDEQGNLYDIVAGPMLVAGLSEESFASLTKEQIAKYEKFFHQPEIFVRMGRDIMPVPMPDEMVKKAKARAKQLAGNKEKNRNNQER